MIRTHISPRPGRRSGPLALPILLVLVLLAAACSSQDSTSSPSTADSTPAPPGVDQAESDGDADSSGDVEPDAPAPAATVAPEQSALDTYLADLDGHGFNGVVAVRDGDTASTQAFGLADREGDVATDAETVFDIGSLTKQFTAAAILRLEMDGALSVEDTLGDHLDGLPADMAAVTLHQLMTHTGGFHVGLSPDDDPIDREAFLELVVATPRASAPGERFEYSNVGYSLLGIVIEVVTGGSYEEYMRTAVFEPAGMEHTGYLLPDWEGRTLAVGYVEPRGDRFGVPTEQNWAADGPGWHLRANGGLLSTAADMLRWDEALSAGTVLDEAATAKFFASHVPNALGPGVGYGYGWTVVSLAEGGPIITHDGSNNVFWASFVRIADADLVVFVATNSARESDPDVAVDIAELLFGPVEPVAEGSADGPGDAPAAAPVDAGDAACGFAGVSAQALPDHTVVDELPDTVSGRAAATLLSLFVDSTPEDRLAFAMDHVAVALGGGDDAAVAETIAELGAALASFDVAEILVQDDLRFHVLFDRPGAQLLLSLGFDEAQPQRVTCLGLSD